MSETNTAATVIYPHQLFSDSPAVTAGRRIYLVEEPLILTENPIHRQKLIFHTLTLDAYEHELTALGHTVTRLAIDEHPRTEDVFARIRRDGITTVHIVDTTDDYLERAITASKLERVWYESPLFILAKNEAIERYQNSKRFMANFYRKLRRDQNILMKDDGTPVGDKWSFDDENRKSLPKHIELPTDISRFGSADIKQAEEWAETVPATQYGEPGCWLPYTRAGAQEFLKEFLRTRLTSFGPYEDAMATGHTRLFHSTLSPLLNVGLLTPSEVLAATLAYVHGHTVPLNSLEGFVRQLIGWREFMRASYECDGRTMRTKNFWNHRQTLPASFWDGTTGISPVDHVITTALTHSYTHHIERLMVMGNFMLLCELHPTEVYRWFMGMYIDAYDWVMVPNVYDMSQFADGGSFATKPYISGGNYIKKMSDFPSGDWEATWTALYWRFIAMHRTVFEQNYRLSMMPRQLDRMSKEKRQHHEEVSSAFLSRLSS